jgi:hypothetical protein
VIGPPDRTEAAEYYFRYIDRVQGTDICRVLVKQRQEMSELLRGISEEQSLFRYAPDKWSIREVLAHVNDGERLFVGRAWWFARGFDTPLPSFDQDVAARNVRADQRSWHDHVDEFLAIRGATVSFFNGLDGAAWKRAGTASDMHMTVRALAYITAGHVIHHAGILSERYLNR